MASVGRRHFAVAKPVRDDSAALQRGVRRLRGRWSRRRVLRRWCAMVHRAELLAARDAPLPAAVQIVAAAIRQFRRRLENGRVALNGQRVARLGSRVADVESPRLLVDSAVAAHVRRFRWRRLHRHRPQRERPVARVVGRQSAWEVLNTSDQDLEVACHRGLQRRSPSRCAVAGNRPTRDPPIPH